MPLAPGIRLGPYEILTLIGAGGMGEVYKARDTRLGRDVAIKISAERFSERFEREARAVAALNHPHICTLYDVGPNYLVMEYLEGVPLKGPLPAAEALRLAAQTVEALETAHAKGIVHRDLKPANVLVTRFGVKLLDFGLAKSAADADATQTMAVMGTPAYMSLEQAEGKPLDARSDIFSFGAVLYEMLSGSRPFPSLAALLRDDPAPLESPAEMVRIVTRCLHKSSAERFQTAAELRAALETVKIGAAAEPPSIAVLPFANLSADKDNEYFSAGLAEEILNALTQLPGLRVIARTSAFRFREEQDLRAVGQARK
jgi:serine/threonine protein kinase